METTSQPLPKGYVPSSTLLVFNAFMALIHGTSAIVMGAIIKDEGTIPATHELANRHDHWTHYTAEIGQIQLGWLAIVFLGVTALDHFLVCLPFVRDTYERDLMRRVNRLRWFEYLISQPVMHVLVAIQCGMTDIHTIASILVNVLMAIYALKRNEWMNQKKKAVAAAAAAAVTKDKGSDADDEGDGEVMVTGDDRLARRPSPDMSHYYGAILAYLITWVIIASYFVRSMLVFPPTPIVLWLVPVPLFVIDVLFVSFFAAEQHNSCCFGRYVNAEYAYQLLSLLAKQALAWSTYAVSLNIK